MVTIKQLGMKYPMDMGAPIPKIISTDSELILLFNVDVFDNPNVTENSHEINNLNNSCTAIVKFEKNVIHKFGTPNDELIIGHPYYKMGLRAYSFWKVDDSDWKKEVIRIQAKHPYFNENSFNLINHYIFTFKDNTFECLAENYEIEYSYNSMNLLFKHLIKEFI